MNKLTKILQSDHFIIDMRICFYGAEAGDESAVRLEGLQYCLDRTE